jgi:hypothetical protein
MRYLKLSLYVILGLLVIYVGVCAFGPDDFKVNRSITIAAAPSAVFSHVADFAQWKDWSPWQKKDPALAGTYAGTPGTVGHQWEWKSKKEGDGTQEIVELRQDSYIKTALSFRPDKSDKFYSTWTFEGDSTQTKVTWDMDSGKVPYMMRGMLLILDVEKMMDGYYEEGLKDLKKTVEKNSVKSEEHYRQ